MDTRSLIAVGLAAMVVVGGGALAATASPPTSVSSSSAVLSAGTSATGLDPTIATYLLALVDEERMAHDLYRTFSDAYAQARPFSMIVNSETHHVASVRRLLAAYGIADPTVALPAGTYPTPAIQALFDQWKASGLASLEEAEQVGVHLETRDIADLKVAIASSTRADVTSVLIRLVSASENHLRAFTAAVADTSPGGVTEGRPEEAGAKEPGCGQGVGMSSGSRSGMGSGMGAGRGNGAGGPAGRR